MTQSEIEKLVQRIDELEKTLANKSDRLPSLLFVFRFIAVIYALAFYALLATYCLNHEEVINKGTDEIILTTAKAMVGGQVAGALLTAIYTLTSVPVVSFRSAAMQLAPQFLFLNAAGLYFIPGLAVAVVYTALPSIWFYIGVSVPIFTDYRLRQFSKLEINQHDGV